MNERQETIPVDGSQLVFRADGKPLYLAWTPQTYAIHVAGSRIHIDKDGYTTFEGDNLDDAARAFFEHAVCINNQRMQQLMRQIESLRSQLDHERETTNG
ncbi:hypothetical protein AAGT95_03065 [Salinicola lusitanus]|uniref:Uncharacterized protein n=1 Tax=Salinicola lusitanus TaxID=1949085 RepID=A0ABZ3CV80_9GAMM